MDGVSVGAVASYDFTNVTANHTIAASFAIDTYTITASAGANGSIAPNGVTTVNYGGSQSYTITPDAHYHVADVLVDGVSVGRSARTTSRACRRNHTIAASFAIDQNIITASAGANGSITPSGAVAVNYGADQSFTITPDAHYHVADVLVDGSSVGAVTSYTFTNVTTSHTIAASFAIDTYTITASAGANGSIAPSGVTTVNYGGSQVPTITPNGRTTSPTCSWTASRRPGDELHVHLGGGEPHHLRDLRHRPVHDHRLGGRARFHRAERNGRRELR